MSNVGPVGDLEWKLGAEDPKERKLEEGGLEGKLGNIGPEAHEGDVNLRAQHVAVKSLQALSGNMQEGAPAGPSLPTSAAPELRHQQVASSSAALMPTAVTPQAVQFLSFLGL